MKIVGPFVFIAIFALLIFGQTGTQVTGYVGRIVSGNEKGVPYPNVTVTLRLVSDTSVNYTSVTDAEGKYRFENVPGGRYVISVAPPSADRTQNPKAAIDVTAGQAVEKDFALSSIAGPNCVNCEIRETVTISADAVQPVEEVSKSVSTIVGQEMRDRADITLVDSLRTIPGLRVQQLGGFGRTASIKSRGLRNQDTAVLIDGIRFRDPAAITGDASPFLSDITLTSVSRAEVLRGPGSSLYGTNAIGGTIDLQTPIPQSGWHGQVSGAAGGLGLGRFRGNISKGTDDGKFGFNAALSRTVYTKGIDGDDEANNTNFQSRIEINPYERTNISARFFLSDAFVRLNTGPDTAGTPPASNFGIIDAVAGVNFAFDANDPDDTQKSRYFNGQFVLTQSITDELAFQAYYAGSTTKRTNDNGVLGIGFQSPSTSIFEGTAHTANAHIDWTPIAANRLTVGYEFEQENFRNEGSTPSGTGGFFTDASQASSTIYLQDLVHLLEGRLQFAGGFRAQFFNLANPGFSGQNPLYSDLSLDGPPAAYTFDGSASYFIRSTGTKLRTHAGTGYRVPSLYERFGSFFNTFTFPDPPRFEALGDPNLKPERAVAFDAGLDQYFWGRRITASAVYFYSKLTDVIGFGNVVPDIGNTPRFFGGYINQKGGVSRGVELSGSVRPTSSTSVFASYSFTNSDQLQPQVTGSGVFATLGVPKHQVTFSATQRIDRFWINADFTGTSTYLAPIFSNSTFNSYVYRFKGSRRLDLTAGYTFAFGNDRYSLRLFGTIENLFDDEYFENGFRTPGRTGRIGLSFGF
ncbi:MAG: TonB-dependent receptor [Acidobacteria bacterium]|nr:TonB-dependent receptor [Acidobacteriota bacterium]